MNNSEHSNQPLDKYTDILDFELQNVFDVAPDLEMYRHMAYFMGFADENLALKRSYGGKRFRSKLTLLLGDCYGILEKVVPAAVSIELFHNSTLIHDDIVDGDTLRRGRPTVWKLVGKDHAINSGDAQILMSLRPVL
ncbi:polyprenyl synthetase family protein, partial [Candidatus Kaiserbacteria bacterium]|nr:polyprenyl synthetase family protein [Candidatus Kaiserbacteria bacterium]